MELKAKGVLVHGNIDNRCLRVEHHQDSHANARPVMLRVKSFFVSVHLPKFFGSENLDDAASAINDYTTQKDLAKKKKQFVSDTLLLLTNSKLKVILFSFYFAFCYCQVSTFSSVYISILWWIS
jgi:hypothetical protein